MNKEIINKLKELEVLHLLRKMMEWYMELKEDNANENIVNAVGIEIAKCLHTINGNYNNKEKSEHIVHVLESRRERVLGAYFVHRFKDKNKREIKFKVVVNCLDEAFKHFHEIKELTKDN